ncbi:hypothetical protein VTO73DRAFT_8899 [Trametes versicolor]
MRTSATYSLRFVSDFGTWWRIISRKRTTPNIPLITPKSSVLQWVITAMGTLLQTQIGYHSNSWIQIWAPRSLCTSRDSGAGSNLVGRNTIELGESSSCEDLFGGGTLCRFPRRRVRTQYVDLCSFSQQRAQKSTSLQPRYYQTVLHAGLNGVFCRGAFLSIEVARHISCMLQLSTLRYADIAAYVLMALRDDDNMKSLRRRASLALAGCSTIAVSFVAAVTFSGFSPAVLLVRPHRGWTAPIAPGCRLLCCSGAWQGTGPLAESADIRCPASSQYWKAGVIRIHRRATGCRIVEVADGLHPEGRIPSELPAPDQRRRTEFTLLDTCCAASEVIPPPPTGVQGGVLRHGPCEVLACETQGEPGASRKQASTASREGLVEGEGRGRAEETRLASRTYA